MVESIGEALQQIKRDAAAADTHAKQRIAQIKGKADSRIRKLSRRLAQHVGMLNQASWLIRWSAHKLQLLLDQFGRGGTYQGQNDLKHFLDCIVEDLASFRNDCDNFVDNGLDHDIEPDWGPVPDSEGGALVNECYSRSSNAMSAGNAQEQCNEAKNPVSRNSANTTDVQTKREESPHFVEADNHQSNKSAPIKPEVKGSLQASLDNPKQCNEALSNASRSIKRTRDSEDEIGHDNKRKREE
ncbi:hypothetical protein IL306_002378 [Fusarium sp. DS 682]|nr:hypothetical protein IL306_002378 [Fusarium sp. DS 682]